MLNKKKVMCAIISYKTIVSRDPVKTDIIISFPLHASNAGESNL